MDRLVLSDVAWERMAPLIIGRPDQKGSTGRDNRMFVEGVLWIVRTGSPWRDLPEASGDWNSVFRRFSRWSIKGVWYRMFEAMSDDPDFEYLIIDSTIVRAHQHAAGAKKGGLKIKAIGRSRGGLSTKIHMAVRGLGCPVRFTLTAGQKGDAPQAAALIEGFPAEVVMADTAYDADHLRQAIAAKGASPSFPTIRHGRSNIRSTNISMPSAISWSVASQSSSSSGASQHASRKPLGTIRPWSPLPPSSYGCDKCPQDLGVEVPKLPVSGGSGATVTDNRCEVSGDMLSVTDALRSLPKRSGAGRADLSRRAPPQSSLRRRVVGLYLSRL